MRFVPLGVCAALLLTLLPGCGSSSRRPMKVWGEVTFDYASTDTLDFVPTATAA